MQVVKAVITAAGRGAGGCPASEAVPLALFPIVDRDGQVKPVIQVIVEEAVESGIEEICVVTAPGDEHLYRRHFNAVAGTETSRLSVTAGGPHAQQTAGLARRLRFVTQEPAAGFGHAVWCAREFAGGEPFLLMVGDHLYVSSEERRCARQVLDLAAQEECSVAGVQATREHLIHHYGTVAGKRLPGQSNVFQIEEMIEKPTLSVAEQRLHVPGLRVGHYLCFFGMHVLTPTIFELLDEAVRAAGPELRDIQLTPAMRQLARRERFLAVQTNGRRHDIGTPYGLLEAQAALAFAGADRDLVLARIMELLLQFEQDRRPDAASHNGRPRQAD
jgi:UTP--glucose-1-phosphate uridylyltransferase